MTNSSRGEVEVKLAGKTYPMCPTFQKLREIEHRTDMGVMEIAQRFAEDKAGIDQIATVLAVGLSDADGAPDYDAIGEALMRQGMGDVLGPIMIFLGTAIIGDKAKNLLAPQGKKSRKASPGGA